MPLMDRGVNGYEISTVLVAIPNSDTNVIPITKKAKINAIVLSNPTGAAIDVTIKTGAATGGTSVIVQTVAAKSCISIPSSGSNDFDGLIVTGGLSWLASATGAFGQVIGTQQG